VAGVDHLGSDAERLQGRVGALPIDAGALHDHLLGLKRRAPLRERPAVFLEGTELALLDVDVTVGLFEDGTGGHLPLMHIESDDTLEDRYQFHVVSRRNTLQEVGDGAAGPSEPEGGKRPSGFLTCAL
jgi:hypothetical protein